MQVAPEQALARLPAHGRDAAFLPAWPPQVEAGEYQQDCPAGGNLD